MSKKKDDFMSAMFPTNRAADAPEKPAGVIMPESVEEAEPVEEEEAPAERPAARKAEPHSGERQKSDKKSFLYFCWTSDSVDYKIREIARRNGISLSAMIGQIMETAIGNYEKSNGEITVRERKGKKKTGR